MAARLHLMLMILDISSSILLLWKII